MKFRENFHIVFRARGASNDGRRSTQVLCDVDIKTIYIYIYIVKF